jgi:hypothetical protein
MNLPEYRLALDGAILARGFWIYVWKIQCGSELAIYVGRTGDSSSPNASSLFRRAGQHLDLKGDAKGNSLKRAIDRLGWKADSCLYEQIALGPFFEEQSTMEAHIPYRDRIAAIEYAVSKAVKDEKFLLIGNHGSSHSVCLEDGDNLNSAIRQVLNFLRGTR